MNKRMVAASIAFAFLLAVPVSAHYSGVVEDFLVGVTDETSADRLRGEIEDTRKEIASLTPQLERLKQDYEVNQDAAVTKLQFYHSIGPDVYMNFILNSENVVDIMANQRMVELQLAGDLDKLNELYLQYRQVKSETETLMGHEALLSIIQKNLEGRTRFFEVTKNFPLQRRIDAALDVWNDKAVLPIEKNLKADSAYILQNVQQLMNRTADKNNIAAFLNI